MKWKKFFSKSKDLTLKLAIQPFLRAFKCFQNSRQLQVPHPKNTSHKLSRRYSSKKKKKSFQGCRVIGRVKRALLYSTCGMLLMSILPSYHYSVSHYTPQVCFPEYLLDNSSMYFFIRQLGQTPASSL